MVGDVIGRGGRQTLATVLPQLRSELAIDFVCVQGENIAGGFGITRKTADFLLTNGADVITSGNHIWDKPQIAQDLEDKTWPVLRPLNYSGKPGRGAWETGHVAVINLMGNVFMKDKVDSPFKSVSELLNTGFGSGKPIIVDIHAEASSEKQALAWYLDGKVAAVCGTHTHVPTADPHILPNGTAYATDLGMVGATHSVVGMRKEESIERFVTGSSAAFRPVERGAMQFNSVLIHINTVTLRATKIERIDRRIHL